METKESGIIIGGVVLVPYDVTVSLVKLQNAVNDTHRTLHSDQTLRVSAQTCTTGTT